MKSLTRSSLLLKKSLFPSTGKDTVRKYSTVRRSPSVVSSLKRPFPKLFAQAGTTMPRTVDWNTLSFGLDHVGDVMFKATSDASGNFKGDLCPYGPLELMPSAQVLNYGQAVFEGMKAQRTNKDRIVLFRPTVNAERMETGASRMSMPAVPRRFFVEAVKKVVEANKDLVPPQGKGSMYIRPLLIGSAPILGLGPASEYTFAVFCAAVGAYFKGGQLKPIDLIIEEKFHRAAPGGMGATKCAGNYSQVLLTQLEAKKNGYDDVVYLDAVSNTNLEEVSSCNIFVVKDNTVKTPPLKGTILPGVTRRSVMEIAKREGLTVIETEISAREAMEADEVFTTGTAVVLSTLGSLTYRGERRQYGKEGEPTPIGLKLYRSLTGIMNESTEDPFGWIETVC